MPTITRLKQHRQRALMTQRDLAERAGVTVQTLVRLEHGRTKPHLSTVKRLADALEIDADQLWDATPEWECEALTGDRTAAHSA